MPLIKVIRNGQITIPKEMRFAYGIADGDFVEIQATPSGMLIKPKEIVDKKMPVKDFKKLVKKMRAKVKDVDQKEIDDTIQEAIKASKAFELKKMANSQ
jgi:AbrB family looped-hinge helix DNA binding protein